MKNTFKYRFTYRSVIGMLAAGLLIAGCSSGEGPSTSNAGSFGEGPFVPFSFTANGRPGAAERSSSQAADIVASPPIVEGHFGMQETDNTDTGTATCRFTLDHRIDSDPNVWVSECSELAESSCSIPGYNLYISDDPSYCVGKDNCLTVVFTDSTSDNGNCSVYVYGSKLSSQILASGVDRMAFNMVSTFNFATTAQGDFSTAGVRVATMIAKDSTGAFTFPDAADVDASAKFIPSAGLSTDATLTTMYDDGYTWSQNQAQSAVFRVSDKNDMSVNSVVSFTIPLEGSLEGGTFVKEPEYGLLAGAQLCDVIDTGPAYCPSVLDNLKPGFAKLGASMNEAKTASISMSSVNGDRVAAMKTVATNTATIKTYDAQTATWRDISSFNDIAPEAIDAIYMDVNHFTTNWDDDQFTAATVSVLTTDYTTKFGTIRQSQDGVTWRDFGLVDEAMSSISMVSDLSSTAGNVYVAYMKDSIDAMVRYCNVDGCADTSLAAAVEAMPGYASTTGMSNIAYDSFNSYASVAVTWKDVNGGDHLTVFKNDDGWREAAATLDVTASQVGLVSTTTVSRDLIASITAVAYADANGGAHMAVYNAKDQVWTEVLGGRTAALYTVADSSSRMTIAFNSRDYVAYTAVRDNSALKIVEVNLADYTAKDVGTIELNGYVTKSPYVIMGDSQTVTVGYADDTREKAYVKEATLDNGIIIIPCDGEICGPNGGGPK